MPEATKRDAADCATRSASSSSATPSSPTPNALRESLSEERDGLAQALGSARQVIAAQGAECERLERAIAAQERIIAYRQSARWWFSLPWLRVRLWWQRLRGE